MKKKIQSQGIEEAKKIKNLSVLIQPIVSWYNKVVTPQPNIV